MTDFQKFQEDLAKDKAETRRKLNESSDQFLQRLQLLETTLRERELRRQNEYAEITCRDMSRLSPELEKKMQAYYLDMTGEMRLPEEVKTLPRLQYSKEMLLRFAEFVTGKQIHEGAIHRWREQEELL